MKRIKKQSANKDRRGTAATEFAVCLPILLVLVIGTIEACSMIYLKQSLSTAAYEGARASLIPGATTADVTAACNRILTPRKVAGSTIMVNPSGFESQPQQTWITVRVTASGGANSVVAGWFYDSLTIDGQATMMKEF